MQFEADEEKKESETIKKDTVFNMEDMMAPDNNVFDFLNVKLAPVDEKVPEKVEEASADTNKGTLSFLKKGPQNVDRYNNRYGRVG